MGIEAKFQMADTISVTDRAKHDVVKLTRQLERESKRLAEAEKKVRRTSQHLRAAEQRLQDLTDQPNT